MDVGNGGLVRGGRREEKVKGGKGEKGGREEKGEGRDGEGVICR